MIPKILLAALSIGLMSGATWTVPAFKPQTTSLLLYNGGEAATTIRLELLGKPTGVDVTLAAKQSWDATGLILASYGSFAESCALRVTADQPMVILAKESGANLPVFAMDEVSEEGTVLQALWLRNGEAGSAAVELAVLAAGTRLDIVLFDAAGRSQGTQSYTSGVGLLTVDLTARLAMAPTARRAELRLLAGRLAGVMTLTAATGVQRYRLAEEGFTAGQVWFVQVRRGAGFRIFNNSTRVSKVKVTAVRSSFGDTLPVNFDLASGEHAEVVDALSAWFASPDDGEAILNIQSNQPILVLGTKVGFPEEFVSESVMGTGPSMDWVPSFDTSALFPIFSGDRGASVDLILRTPDGELLGQASVEWEAWSKVEVNLREATQVELPERVNVEIVGRRGAIQANAELRLNPYRCALPELELRPAETLFPALPQPVQVEVFWSTTGADRVVLDEEGGEVAAAGSKMFPVTATRTFTLRATNSCGTVLAIRSILVGVPAVTGLQSSRPAVAGSLVTAQPGERLTLNLGAVVPFDAVTAFSVSAAGAQTRWVSAERTETGQIAFTVPLLPLNGLADTVYSGAAEVRMVIDEAEGAPFRFQLAPLTYTGDAVADFRKWFEDYVAWSAARRAELSTTADGAKYLSFLTPLMDAEAISLRGALAQIAATGSAVIGVDQPSLAYPVPATVTVTRANLEQLMALKERLSERTDRAPAGITEAIQASQKGRAAAGGDEWALQKDPTYAACLRILQQEIDSKYNPTDVDRFLQTLTEGIGALGGALAAAPSVSLFNRFTTIGGRLDLFCKIYPMGLKRFTATSSPNPIPYLDFLDSTGDTPAITNKGTQIFARLEPLLDRATAADQLASLMEGRITKQSQGQMNMLPPELQHLAKQAAKAWAQERHAKNKEAFQKYLDSNPAAFIATTKLVYKADITAVPEAIGSAKQRLKQNAVRESDASQAQIPAWGFYGDTSIPLKDQTPQNAKIEVVPFTRHFIFLDPVVSLTDSTYRNRPFSDDILKIPVQIGPVQKGFRVTNQYVAPYGVTGSRGNPQVNDQTPVWLKTAKSIVRGPFQRTQTFAHDDCRGVYAGVGCTRSGIASISAVTQRNTVLEMNVAASTTGQNFPNGSVKSNVPMVAGLGVEFFNPAVRGDTQTITLTFTMKVFNQTDTGVANGRHSAIAVCSIAGSSKGSGISESIQISTGSTTKTLTLSGGVSGFCGISAGGDGNGSSSVKVKVELKTF